LLVLLIGASTVEKSDNKNYRKGTLKHDREGYLNFDMKIKDVVFCEKY
jgi:hypothetical protein